MWKGFWQFLKKLSSPLGGTRRAFMSGLGLALLLLPLALFLALPSIEVPRWALPRPNRDKPPEAGMPSPAWDDPSHKEETLGWFLISLAALCAACGLSFLGYVLPALFVASGALMVLSLLAYPFYLLEGAGYVWLARAHAMSMILVLWFLLTLASTQLTLASPLGGFFLLFWVWALWFYYRWAWSPKSRASPAQHWGQRPLCSGLAAAMGALTAVSYLSQVGWTLLTYPMAAVTGNFWVWLLGGHLSLASPLELWMWYHIHWPYSPVLPAVLWGLTTALILSVPLGLVSDHELPLLPKWYWSSSDTLGSLRTEHVLCFLALLGVAQGLFWALSYLPYSGLWAMLSTLGLAQSWISLAGILLRHLRTWHHLQAPSATWEKLDQNRERTRLWWCVLGTVGGASLLVSLDIIFGDLCFLNTNADRGWFRPLSGLLGWLSAPYGDLPLEMQINESYTSFSVGGGLSNSLMFGHQA